MKRTRGGDVAFQLRRGQATLDVVKLKTVIAIVLREDKIVLELLATEEEVTQVAMQGEILKRTKVEVFDLFPSPSVAVIRLRWDYQKTKV